MPQTPVVVDDYGDETHPAFGMVTVNRTTSSGGVSLFDSEITHQHFVSLRISTATRKRDLSRDWIHPRNPIIEIAMSETQWGALVSSVGSSGVPVTLDWTREEGDLPDIPYEPRMQHNLAEIKNVAKKMFDGAMAALAAVELKPTKVNIRNLRIRMENSAPNVVFAAESLTEHVEAVVNKAKADIEAMSREADRRNALGAPIQLELASGKDHSE